LTDKRKVFLQNGGLDETDPITEQDGKRYKTRKGELVLCCSAEIAKGSKTWLCRNLATKGSKFCLKHGGVPATANTNSMVFTTGLKSTASSRFRNIGKKMLERIEELREDPELWSLKDDTAYITALLDMRAEAAAEGVSFDQYKKIQEMYKTCNDKKYQEDFWETFDELGKAINNTMSEFAATKDVLELIEKRTEIVETEQRLLHQKAYTLEVDQAFSLVMQIVNIINRSVTKDEELQSIKAGIGKLLTVYKQSYEDEVIDAEVIDGTEKPSEYQNNTEGTEEIHTSG
jgi:hypothetical protein